MTFADFCDAKYDLPAGSDDLVRVSIEGYLAPPETYNMCSDTCSFDLLESPEPGSRSIRYSVRFGSSKNHLEPLSDSFKLEDFQLHTQGGNTVGLGDKVRLSGGRLGTAAQDDCQLYRVDLIEAP